MGLLIITAWVIVGGILIVAHTIHFNKFEDYVAKEYREEYQNDTIFFTGGRGNRGGLRLKILVGRYNPHPNDPKFNRFILVDRILTVGFIFWIACLFVARFLTK